MSAGSAGFNSPPFPAEDEVLVVAEWVELSALASKEGTFALGALQMACSRSDIVSKSMPEDTWAELERRAAVCGERWPFEIDATRIVVRQAPTTRVGLYWFLAALAMRTDVTRENRGLFERCVADLMAGLTSRPGMAVGFERRPPVPPELNAAIKEYCAASEEDGIHRPFPGSDRDLDVDVVAWFPFSDGRGSFLHLVGQCATGADWKDKLTELNPHKWSDHLSWAVPPTRFFATPLIVRKEEMRRLSMDGGLMLDRPRLLELEQRRTLGAALAAEVKEQSRQFYADS